MLEIINNDENDTDIKNKNYLKITIVLTNLINIS